MNGFQYESLKHKLTELESLKEELMVEIQKKQLEQPMLEPIDKAYLELLFRKHKEHLSNRNLEQIKNFIFQYPLDQEQSLWFWFW